MFFAPIESFQLVRGWGYAWVVVAVEEAWGVALGQCLELFDEAPAEGPTSALGGLPALAGQVCKEFVADGLAIRSRLRWPQDLFNPEKDRETDGRTEGRV